MDSRSISEKITEISLLSNHTCLDVYENNTALMRFENNENKMIAVRSWSGLRKYKKLRYFNKNNKYTFRNIEILLQEKGLDYTIKKGQVYGGYSSYLYLICKKHGEFRSSLAAINQGRGCPYCSGRLVETGINDIATVRPDLIRYFVNKSDSEKYKKSSCQKLWFICPDCGYKKNMVIGTLSRRGFSCNLCSDGFSVPNKFISNVIHQTKYRFVNEKKFDNSCYLYDLYVESNDLKYTIEVHGMQHYKDTNGNWQSYEHYQKENDRKKRFFSESIGNIHIEIDCRYSDFKYMKDSILNSLKNHLDLSEVDFEEAYRKSLRSIVVEACELKNRDSKLGTLEISNILNINRSTATEYLKIGNRIGLCKYIPSKSVEKQVVKYDLNMNYIKKYNSIRSAVRDGHKLNSTGIINCCKFRQRSHGSFIWRYYKESD